MTNETRRFYFQEIVADAFRDGVANRPSFEAAGRIPGYAQAWLLGFGIQQGDVSDLTDVDAKLAEIVEAAIEMDRERRTPKALRIVATHPCPGCGGERHAAHPVPGLYRCLTCGGIHGTCYRGEARQVVADAWHEGPADPEDTFYFDLTILGGDGQVERSHGWAHKTTRRIVQIG